VSEEIVHQGRSDWDTYLVMGVVKIVLHVSHLSFGLPPRAKDDLVEWGQAPPHNRDWKFNLVPVREAGPG
jgi:hypothetical protein